MTGIQALIAGWLLKEIDIHSTLTKIGDFLFKAGIGISEASLVISTVAYSGAFNSPTYKPMGAGARVSNPFLDKSILGVN